METRTRMLASFLLWRATPDRARLAEAKHLFDFLVAHAPPDFREPMAANVRLHREIEAAWQEDSAAGGAAPAA